MHNIRSTSHYDNFIIIQSRCRLVMGKKILQTVCLVMILVTVTVNMTNAQGEVISCNQ
jgi:hypothetical protein